MASTLKEFRVSLGLSIDGVVEFIYGTVDPSVSGRAAGVGSIYLRNDSTFKQVWQKFGSGNTDWRIVDVGAPLTPVTRTNNPTLAANQANANISSLDNAIGADSQLTPLSRTVGQIALSDSLYQMIEKIDTILGADSQLTNQNYVNIANSIMTNLSNLDGQVQSLTTGVNWYSPSPFVITDDADLRAASNGTALSTLLPFSDDEGGQLVIGDFNVDDLLVSRNNGSTHKIFKVYDDGGTLKITTVGVTQLSVGHTFFVRHALVVVGSASEQVSAFRYNGTDITLFMQFDVETASTISLTSSYSPTNGNIVNTDTVQQAIEKLDGNQQDLQTLSGVAQGSTNLGAFTDTGKGSVASPLPILGATETVKTALQTLSTFTAKERTERTQTNITTITTVDEVLVDSVDAVKWTISAREPGNPTRVQKDVVTAIHDGHSGADASNVDYDRSSILKLNTTIPGYSITVDLNGTTTSQVMRLRVESTNAVDVKVARQVL